MKVVLDTNVVMWLADDPHVLRPDVLELLAADSTVLIVSAVVPWEVAVKWRSGKLILPEHPREWVARMAREFGTEWLPIVPAHVVGVADLPDHHKDPFDRLLIAQARAEGLPIVTADRKFADYDVEVIAAR